MIQDSTLHPESAVVVNPASSVLYLELIFYQFLRYFALSPPRNKIIFRGFLRYASAYYFHFIVCGVYPYTKITLLPGNF